MSSNGSGVGEALDAGVDTQDIGAEDVAVLSEVLGEEAHDRVVLEAVVASAERKVEKQRAHLAGAEAELAAAVAALEGNN